MNHEHDDFSRRLASAQDAQIDALDLKRQVRDRVLSGAKPRIDRSPRRWWLATGAATVGTLAVAAAALFIVTSGSTEITATQGGAALEVGAWIDASDELAKIDFSDGTVVTLDPGSTARLAAIDEHGAHLMLEKGTADLDVVHTGEADWRVQAGPYTIQVTGTAFETTWEPEQENFHVQMREGSVLVTGPGLPDGGQPVSGVSSLNRSRPEVAVNVVPEPQGEAEVVVEAPVAPTPKAAPGIAEEAETWLDRYKARDYAGAIELANADLSSVLADSSASELANLADAGKLAKNASVEKQALDAVRSRFAGTTEAANAALELGRLSERQGDWSGAATWYGTAHTEKSGYGSMALGLQMTALSQAGDVKAAKQAANEYLEAYPTGSYATKAKELAKRKR